MLPPWVYAVVLAGTFAAGWQVHSWKIGADERDAIQGLLDERKNDSVRRDTRDGQFDKIQVDLRRLATRKPPVCDYTPEQLRVVNNALRGGVPAVAGTDK